MFEFRVNSDLSNEATVSVAARLLVLLSSLVGALLNYASSGNSVIAAVFVLCKVFIESVTMVPRDPLVQSRCTKKQPYARAN